MSLSRAALEDLLAVVVAYKAHRRSLGEEHRPDLDALKRDLEREILEIN
jgi:hypothetical protein